MEQRIYARLSDVGGCPQIPFRIKQQAWVTTFRPAIAKIVCRRIHPQLPDVGSFFQIKVYIEDPRRHEPPQYGIPVADKVPERIHTRGSNARVLRQILARTGTRKYL